MKILHAVSGWPPEHAGETERYVQRLARAQAAAGHAVLVAAGSASDRYAGAFRRTVDGEEGITVHRVSQRGPAPERWDHGSGPFVARVFGELLAGTAPDLVHVHHWARLSRSLVRRAARAGIPSVLTLHDAAAVCPRGSRVRPGQAFCELPPSVASCLDCVPRETWVGDEAVSERIGQYYVDALGELRAAAALVVPSRAHARLLASHSGLPEAGFVVVPLPSSVEWERRPEAPWAPGCGRPLRVACWGGLRAEDGAPVLLEALRRLGRAGELELVLWGPGDGELERHLAALGGGRAVERRSAFEVDDLRELRADLAVLPALCHEAHGHALDAALALRLPVLVSDRGALPERAGAGGLAFAPGDATALAARLAQVLDDPARLASMRAALPRGRSAAEHWSALEPIYARALARRPGDAALPYSDTDDRERWERIARAYEDLGRDLTCLRMSAEGEVKGLRRDVSEVFSRLNEELAKAAGHSAEVRVLQGRIDEMRALEVSVTTAKRESEREARRLQGEAQELRQEVAQREREARKLRRENRLALPLVWPARALLWAWDLLRGKGSARRQEADSP